MILQLTEFIEFFAHSIAIAFYSFEKPIIKDS